MAAKKQVEISFSSDEIEKHTILHEDKLCFYKRDTTAVKVDGKDWYSGLLCHKLREAFGSKTTFRVTASFRQAKKFDGQTCHVLCGHGSLASVSYTELKLGSCLKLSVKTDCIQCFDDTSASSVPSTSAAPSTSSAQGPSTSSVQGPSTLPQVSILPDSEIFDVFTSVTTALTNKISDFYSTCAGAEDPMTMLRAQKEEFGRSIHEAFDNALQAIPALQNIPLLRVSPAREEPPPPPPPASQRTIDANAALTLAAQRVADERRQRRQATGSQDPQQDEPASKRPRTGPGSRGGQGSRGRGRGKK